MPRSSFCPRTNRRFLAPALLVLAAVATLAGPEPAASQALLVSDVNTAGITTVGYVGFGGDAVGMGQLHFFSGDDGASGREPWVLHLDTGVAERLADLYPGPTSSSPEQFLRAGSTVLFVATTPNFGKELWVSDGTPTGTVLVRDIAPGSASSSPVGLFALPGGWVVFSAFDAVAGAELWISDGTSGGTTIVADINPGVAGSSPGQFALAGGVLYFRANDGVSGSELWRWTGGGVSQVADIEVGPGSGSPSGLYGVGSNIVFSACTVANGCEPWVSDGSGAGTVPFANIHPTGSSYPNGFFWHPGLARLFFSADDGVHGKELWQSVGGVTTRVTDLAAGSGNGYPNGFAALASKLIFTGSDGGGGTRLYTYDGATVIQIKSLSTAGVPSNPTSVLSWNGRIYFGEGSACWYTDGTTVGTVAWDTSCLSSPNFVVGGGRLVFADSVSGEHELWSIDAADLKTQETDLASYSSSPAGFAWRGSEVFFSADDGISGRELWVSDGTPAGTAKIDVNPGAAGSSPTHMTAFAGQIWFSAETAATGIDLWHSDGTSSGTLPYELIPGSSGSYPSNFVVLGSSLFVSAYDDLLGEQLFRVTGAALPPEVLDVDGESDLSPDQLVVAGSRVFFFGETSATGRELFSLAEHDAEPTPLEIVAGAGDPYGLDELTAWNGAVYFVADDGVTGKQIWRSDGTSVARISNLSGGSDPYGLAAGPGGLYFVFNEPTLGSEVWRTNGVTTGPVTDIAPLAAGAYPSGLMTAGDRLYFKANDGTSGDELWWTDGSQVGQVADLRPGADGSYPEALVAAGSRLIFSADDGSVGRELYIVDGSSCHLLPEAWPGVGASSPQEVAVDPAVTRIYFSAFGPATWREPYRIDLVLFRDGFEGASTAARSSTVP